MSYSILPDGTGAVNRRTVARLAGRGPVVGRFLAYDFNSEWRHRTPAELLLHAEQFWCVPPALQPLAYYRLTALAVEACTRLLAVSVVDAGDAESEVAS